MSHATNHRRKPRQPADAENAVDVAIVGGGCASIAAAFELTRPEHRNKYRVTIYQLGWRLGGKGASGRGPSGRIEEHGLHVWMGFYENAFRLLRECYAELGRSPEECPIADWRDAFFPDPFVGVADLGRDGNWMHRTASFPPAEGLPGDPLTEKNPFTVRGYLLHTVSLLRTLLTGVETEPSNARGDGQSRARDDGIDARATSREGVSRQIAELFRYGLLSTTAGLIAAVGLLDVILRSLPSYPENVVLDLLQRVSGVVRGQLEAVVEQDEEVRYKWEIIDLVVAIMVGIIRHGLLYHPKGFDAINDYECTEWLKLNGASEKSVRSAFVRGLHDLAFAYGKDGPQPGLAAGQAIRGSLRMLFTYRGAIFWKMRAGMGDIVFAPFYEVLKKRGVKFEFFHRLKNVKIAEPGRGSSPHVESLEFEVQAKIKRGREYRPLIDVQGLPCWPSSPDYDQLVDGGTMQAERRDFESDWDRRHVATKTLRVVDDFDFVVLGIGVGAIPDVCSEILARDEKWRSMVEHVTTVETQAFQLWLREDMEAVGWTGPPVNISGYVNPFNTWADMRQLIPLESWPDAPRGIAYFCNALPDDPSLDRGDPKYPQRRREQVKQNAIHFLNRDISLLWPNAVTGSEGFRWDLLLHPASATCAADQKCFDSQFWVANVNRSDRYVLAPPGSLEHRISPLDETYDNLTIAGDWTDCGFNEGCVEAAVMSGRLAAHAICQVPALEEIIGYDHP